MIALMMKAVRTSETSVYFNETTLRYIPEGCHTSISISRTSHRIGHWASLIHSRSFHTVVFKVHFNIILPLQAVSSLQVFAVEFCTHVSYDVCYMPRAPHPSWCDRPDIWLWVRTTKLCVHFLNASRNTSLEVRGAHVMDRVTVGQIFLRVRRFSPVSNIPPCLSILISPVVWRVGSSHSINKNNNMNKSEAPSNIL
jgi:hypothetical protein